MSKWKWDSYYLTGFMGIVIYGILFIYSFQQLILSNWFKNHKIKYFNYKIAFHIIFSLCSLFEVIYYFSYMLIENSCAWGYSFHLTALFLNIVYFGMVVNLWGYTLDYFDYYRKFSFMSSILIVCNFILLIIGLYCLCAAGGFRKFQRNYREVYVVLFVTYSLSVALFAFILLLYGGNITYKLSQTYDSVTSSRQLTIQSTSTSTIPPVNSAFQIHQRTELTKKRSLVSRIVFVLIICLVCYLLRVVLIVLNIYDFLYPNNHREFTEWPLSTWFLISSVIPSVGPGVIFLYIMKTTRVTTPPTSASSPEPGRSSTQYNHSNSITPFTTTATTTTMQRKEESMIRFSWYYEENNGEIDRDERQTSITMTTRLLSTDSANKAMIKTILVREEGPSFLSDTDKF